MSTFSVTDIRRANAIFRVFGKSGDISSSNPKSRFSQQTLNECWQKAVEEANKRDEFLRFTRIKRPTFF